MAQKVKNPIAFVAEKLSLKCLLNYKHLPPFLPFYHAVSQHSIPFINGYPVRTPAQFEKELDYMLKFFKPVDLATLLNKPEKGQMHLTFDDGLKCVVNTIAPILKRKGIPATFFVSSGFTGNQMIFHRFKRAWLQHLGLLENPSQVFTVENAYLLDEKALKNNINWEDVLRDQSPYMSNDDLLCLQSDGFSIGGHSIDHPEFWLLNMEQQYIQVAECMKWLNQVIAPEIKAFAFPFSDHGVQPELFERLHHEKLIDASFGTAGLKYDRVAKHYQRVPMEHPANWSARKIIHFQYLYFYIRAIFRENHARRF